MLKEATAKAKAETPGVVAQLCAEEKQYYQRLGKSGPQDRRIDLEEGPEIPPVNRLAPPAPPPVMLIKERVWMLYFDERKHPPQATFNIDGVELHISEWTQAELKGVTLSAANDKIVATYEPI